MSKAWLLINANEGMELAPFKERFRLFEDVKSVVSAAQAKGFSFGMIGTKPNEKLGMMNVYCEGTSIDIRFVKLEVE